MRDDEKETVKLKHNYMRCIGIVVGHELVDDEIGTIFKLKDNSKFSGGCDVSVSGG